MDSILFLQEEFQTYSLLWVNGILDGHLQGTNDLGSGAHLSMSLLIVKQQRGGVSAK